MRRKLITFFSKVLCISFLLCACKGMNESKEESYTLLVYMCGSDLESKRGYASDNIDDILHANMPKNTNVVIQTGGSSSWKNEKIYADAIGRYEVKNGELISVETLAQNNMGESDTLLSFLNFAKETYPADKTSLILWDHGNGSLGEICYDENYGRDSLTLSEIEAALQAADIKFDFIGFDACLMATYDVADMVKNYAKYMIASEELVPSSGWNYKTLIESLDESDLYSKALNSYIEKHNSKTYYTLSTIKLSEMNEVDRVLNQIIQKLDYDSSVLTYALDDTISFGANETNRYNTNLFDLGLFASNLGIQYDFSSFIQIANGSARQKATGLSFFFPANKSVDQNGNNNQEGYLDVCRSKEYLTFLKSYLSRIPDTPIEFDLKGFDNNGQLSFSLKEESLQYVQTVEYDVHICHTDISESTLSKPMYYIGAFDDVSKSHALYTVDFSGKWVYLNDLLLHCDILEKEDKYTVYFAPIIINNENCYLVFTYISSAKKAIIEGYIESSENTPRINPLQLGTEITVVYESSENENTYYVEGSVIYDSNTLISMKDLPVGQYQCIPRIVDVFGNVYYADTAFITFDGNSTKIDDIATG